MGLDGDDRYYRCRQRVGGFIAVKKTTKMIDLINEWLRYCGDLRIISDQPNQLGQPNYPGFVRYHHEQSVLSLLSHKYQIPAFGLWKQMVKRHYFLKGKKRPGTSIQELIRKATKSD